jgi:RNA polymerase sigma-70 factor (ECF subfamily)
MDHTLTLQQEHDLVDAAKRDLSRFKPLYEYYLPRLYRYIYYRSKSVEDAEDITSQVLTKAVKNFSSYQWQGVRFGAWLYRIAHNLLVDYYQRKQALPIDDVPESSVVDDSYEQLDDHLDIEFIRQHVQQFSPDVQHAFTLRLTRGLTNKEIADELAMSEAAVKMMLHRAIKKLHAHHTSYAQ